jgi:hypothetical protein
VRHEFTRDINLFRAAQARAAHNARNELRDFSGKT